MNISTLHKYIAMIKLPLWARIHQYPVNIFHDDIDLPMYTVLVPLYEEASIVKETVYYLSEIDYPSYKMEIFLLIEENDNETRNALPALPDNFSIIPIPDSFPRGKPRSLNYGLIQAAGELLTIYDAEDMPHPQQLRAAAAAFRKYGDEVWALQARLRFNNPMANWLTRLFYAEYVYWYDSYLPYIERSGFPIPLGRTSNHVRVSRLRQIGGWDAFNVTEDADLAMRIYQAGGEIRMLDSFTLEISPVRMRTWLRQRTRWVKGLIQTLLVHSRRRTNLFDIKYYVLCFSGTLVVVYILY